MAWGSGLISNFNCLSPHLVLDARLKFEPIVAASAALRATPHDLELIENCVRKNAEATDDSSWSRWDGAFHRAIAASTRNPITLALAETLIGARQEAAWSKIRRARVGPELRRQSAQDHRRICSALGRRDPNGAAEAMTAHLHQIAHMLAIDIST